MANGYLPTRDADLRAFAINLAAALTADPTAYGLVAADATALTSAANTFDSDLEDSITLQAAAVSGVATKNASREALETAIRPRVALIQANVAVTDALLGAAGLPLHDTGPSASMPSVPSMVTCTPLGINLNRVTWDRNGNPGNTKFDVEAKRGAATEYTLAYSVTATRYDDPSPNGAPVMYRVRARRGKRISPASAETGIS